MHSNDSLRFTLYSSRVSDLCARIRIALNLKGFQFRLISINLAKKENYSQEYTAINHMQTVPLLIIEDGTKVLRLSQSLATLEYLEEAFPDKLSLLPSVSQPTLRAQTRTLVGIIATDIHPLTTHRVGQRLSTQSTSADDNAVKVLTPGGWNKYWITKGLRAYEEEVKNCCGKYSVGDELTLADVVLMPELWTALRNGVDLKQFTNIAQIYQNLSNVNEIQKEISQPEL